MRISTDGFTLLEMLFVLIIGGMMLAVGTREYNSMSNSRAVSNAGNAMVHTANRARSEAMRSGQVVFMRVRPDSGLVRVGTSGGSVLHTLSMGDYGVTMVGSGLVVCYAARGYALSGCTNVNSAQVVGFARGGDTAAVEVLPLGQVRRKQ